MTPELFFILTYPTYDPIQNSFNFPFNFLNFHSDALLCHLLFSPTVIFTHHSDALNCHLVFVVLQSTRWISMTMTIRLLGAPLPAKLIFCLIPIPMILVTTIMTVVLQKHVTQLDWTLIVVDRVQYPLSILKKKKFIYQSLPKHAIIDLFFLIS